MGLTIKSEKDIDSFLDSSPEPDIDEFLSGKSTRLLNKAVSSPVKPTTNDVGFIDMPGMEDYDHTGILPQAQLEKNPIKSLGKSIWNTAYYQLPSSLAGGAAALSGQLSQPLSPSGEDFYIPPVALNKKGQISQKAKLASKKAILGWARNRQKEGVEFSSDLIQSLDQIESPLDAINWAYSAFGQGVAQIPAAIFSGGVTSIGQEIGSIYLDAVNKIAEEKGITPEEVIDKGLDDSASAIAYGTAAGLLDRFGAGKALKTFGKSALKSELRERAKNVLVNGVLTEGVTEGAQQVIESIGASRGAGQSWTDAFKDVDPKEVVNAIAAGSVAGGGLSAIGDVVSKKTVQPQKEVVPKTFKPIIESDEDIDAFLSKEAVPETKDLGKQPAEKQAPTIESKPLSQPETAKISEKPEQKLTPKEEKKVLSDNILAEVEKATKPEDTQAINAKINQAIKENKLGVNEASVLTSFVSSKSQEIQKKINEGKKNAQKTETQAKASKTETVLEPVTVSKQERSPMADFKIPEKEVWKQPLEKVIGEGKVDEFARNWNEEQFLLNDHAPTKISKPIHTSNKVHDLYNIGKVKYQFAAAEDRKSNTQLLMIRSVDPKTEQPIDGNLGEWAEIGEWSGGNMGLLRAYRKEGAGTAFMKYLMETGKRKSPSIGYSPEGLKTVKKAHKQIIQKAISEGKTIPENVLKDYPDLQKSKQKPGVDRSSQDLQQRTEAKPKAGDKKKQVAQKVTPVIKKVTNVTNIDLTNPFTEKNLKNRADGDSSSLAQLKERIDIGNNPKDITVYKKAVVVKFDDNRVVAFKFKSGESAIDAAKQIKVAIKDYTSQGKINKIEKVLKGRERIKADIETLPNRTKSQNEADLAIMDAMAKDWSRQTGRPVDEWYDTRVAGVEASTAKELGKTSFKQDIKKQTVPTFYSNLRKTIEQKMPNKADANTIRGIVKNVKKEEFEWTGLDDYLNEHPKVTKEEVLQFIDENNVRLEETVKGVANIPTEEFTKLHKLLKDEDNLGFDHTAMAQQAVLDKYNPNWRSDIDIEHNPDLINQIIKMRIMLETDYWSRTKFQDYTLPGGNNYKETLLRLPVEKVSEITKLPNSYKIVNNRERGNLALPKYSVLDENGNTVVSQADIISVEKVALRQLNDKNRADTFKSSHFEEPNILAHVRHNDRTDANGDKVLFLEEIQSDWHQAGRKKGYKDDSVIKSLQKEKAVLENEISQTITKYHNRFKELGGKIRDDKLYNDLFEKRIDLKEKLDGVSRRLQKAYDRQSTAVPSVPFKNTWHELAFRRMVREAAEKGYDKIAWTTGEQQAERYDLSKHIDNIQYEPNFDEDGEPTGTYDFVAYRSSGERPTDKVIDEEDITIDRIEELVGKEIAEKIQTNKGQSLAKDRPLRPEWMKLSGVDLKVGGEGMKAFYDKILVNYANKFGKKFGARVEESNVGLQEKPKVDRFLIKNKSTGAVIKKAQTKLMAEDWAANNFPYVEKEIIDTGSKRLTTIAHSLPITDKMRRTATQEGFPLFQGAKGAAEFVENNKAIIHAFEGADASTLAHEAAHIGLESLYKTFDEALPENKPDIQNRIKAVEDFLGVNVTDPNIKEARRREAHEKFARGFEKYLREGKAPNSALRQVFKDFKQWLREIYQNLKGSQIDIKLTDKARKIYDDLLGGRTIDEYKVPREPLDDVVDKGIKLRDSDYVEVNGKKKLRAEMRDLQIKYGPRIFKEKGQYLDEVATSMGISEDELRQQLKSHLTISERQKDYDDMAAYLESQANEVYFQDRKKQEKPFEVQATIPKGKIKTVPFKEKGTLFEKEKPKGEQTTLFQTDKAINELLNNPPKLNKDERFFVRFTGDTTRDMELGTSVHPTGIDEKDYFKKAGKEASEFNNWGEEEITEDETKNRFSESLDQNSDNLIWVETMGVWGFKQDGLNGFGFDTISEAFNFVEKQKGKGAYTGENYAIFTGKELPGFLPEGEVFEARKVIYDNNKFLNRTLFQADKKQTDSPEFKKWFGDSKVVDENGEPLVVYHGTSSIKDFTSFKKSERGGTGMPLAYIGFFFSKNTKDANIYANWEDGRVIPSFLNIENPYFMDIDTFRDFEDGTKKVKDAKKLLKEIKDIHDGIYIEDAGIYIAFEPTQIKSAIGNRGTFDPSNPNILYQDADLLNEVVQKGLVAAEAGKIDVKMAKIKTAPDLKLLINFLRDKAGKNATPAIEGIENYLKGKDRLTPEFQTIFNKHLVRGEERSFPKTLEKNSFPGGEDRLYEVYTDKQAIEQGIQRIGENEESAKRFVLNEDKELSKEQVTTGILLLGKLREDIAKTLGDENKANLAEKQVELADSLSRRLTQAGQAIQGASIVARMSPEGILLYATKKIAAINKTRKATKQLSLKPEDVQKISTISKGIETTSKFHDSVRDVVEIIRKIGDGKNLTQKDLQRMSKLHNELFKQYAPKPKRRTATQAAIERLEKAESEARARLKAKNVFFQEEVPSSVIEDLAIIGAAKIAKTGLKFLDWSNNMAEDLGDKVKPHLKKVFGKSVELWKAENRKAYQMRSFQRELSGIMNKLNANTEITQIELDTVKKTIEKIEKLSGDMRTEALYELQGFMQAFEPISFGRKLATAQTIAQLLNPKTNIRNILGNELFFRLERMNKYLASGIDFTLSNLTGKDRVITFSKAGQGEYWKGLIKGAKAGWEGHNIQNLETQFNLKGSTFKSKHNPLHWMEKAMGASLRGFDFAAYNRVYNQFLGEQAELSIMNKNLKLTEAGRKKYIEDFMRKADLNVLEMADKEGKYMTFQDENKLSKAFVRAKKAMNFGLNFGFGDFILKYPKTPANLLARALEYSPAGIVRSISILNRPFTNPNFQRREALMALSRAITGTFGLTGLGAAMYSMGALSGTDDDDWDVRKFKAEQTGERNYQVNFTAIKRFLTGNFKKELLTPQKDDSLVSYDWAQPVAISIAAGANMAKSISENKGAWALSTDIAYSSLNAALNTIAEQPLLTGIQKAFGSKYNKDIIGKLGVIVSDMPSSFTPTFLSQLRQYTDNNRKISYDPNVLQKALNRAIYKMPFVSKKLPLAYKTIGGEVAEVYKDGNNTLFNVFFNPAFISKYDLEPEIQMIIDPYQAENRKKQFPTSPRYTIRVSQKTLRKHRVKTENPTESFKLTAKDISEMQRIMSEYVTLKFERLSMKGRSYEAQEKIMADIVRDSNEFAKKWFFDNRADEYLGNKKPPRKTFTQNAVNRNRERLN